jgi:Mrp family chromosome partitioning ATPase
MLSRVSMGEEMVALRQRIDALFPDQPSRAIEFIGSREGEGTSTVVGEFARVSAAQFGQRVLLLEMDPHGGGEGGPGLGPNDAVAGGGRLDIARLPQEFLAASPAADSPGPAATWQGLRAAYDLILVDAPPATTSSQGLTVSRQVDGVVLVLAAEDTRWPVAERVKESIERSGGRVLGIVLNKRQYHIPPCIYRRL